MKSSIFKLLQRQQGAATLLVVSVLAIAMALVALTISNTGLMEQRIAGNDLRAREAQEAAEAGLNYGVAWAQKHKIDNNLICSPGALPPGCPTALNKITGSSTGESYSYSLIYTKGKDSIKVTSTAAGDNDQSISANSEVFIKQIPKGLFDSGATMPPPWVINGCVTTPPTGSPNMFLLSAQSQAMVTSLASINLNTVANASLLSPTQLLAAGLKLCLDVNLLGIHLGVNAWADLNADGVLDTATDVGAKVTLDQSKNTNAFTCQPNDTHCAWDEFFKLDVNSTMQVAVDASQQYNSRIPCGPAASVQVYVINNSGPINPGDMTGHCTGTGVNDTTIGAPDKPIVLIIPKAAGCPKFNGGITIYGIVYYESQTACKANGWGGATIYGSIIWESDVDKPNANSKFIEVDYTKYGTLNQVFNIGIDDAVRLPGTWKDF